MPLTQLERVLRCAAGSEAGVPCIWTPEWSVMPQLSLLTQRRVLMAKVIAGITMSIDGYVTGPDDGPGKGLGEGGERLHSWVFGGPWTYADPGRGEPSGEDAAWLAHVTSRIGAVVAGRWTYEAADHWGGQNPWGLPFFIVTHHPEEEPPGGGFTFVSDVEAAVARALPAAGGKDVHVMGGAEVIRQAVAAGIVDELSIIIAPVIMGAGKGLFDGFTRSLDLEHLGVRQSPFATFIDYRIKPS
jgi:dihydrofolate reductase